MTNFEENQEDAAEVGSHSDDAPQQFDPISFEQLDPAWQDAVQRAGWSTLMPVQERALPYLLNGHDLMVQARTGSGKTGAFLLPALGAIDPNVAACQVLILVPTRELAEQVKREADKLIGPAPVQAVAVYGGVRYKQQLQAFSEGAQLVVGTPGRILDHLLKRTLRLDQLRMLIFDEADRLLSIGFYPDMREVQRYLPEHRVQSTMFTATFPPAVQRLARQFLRNPSFIGISSDDEIDGEIDHVFYTVDAMQKDRALVRIIEHENPEAAIIFCNTKTRVHYVSVVLQRFGYDADELSADLSQKARERVLQRVRDRQLRFLVATDVAARGIDIPELSHVFQYEPPDHQEVYVHRAGRTGRAGSSGTAIVLVDVAERMALRKIAKRYELDIREADLPTDEDVAELVATRTGVLLENKMRKRDKLKAERMERFLPFAKQLGETEEGQRVLAMLLDDYYQSTLHEPVTPPATESEKRPNRGQGGERRSNNRRRGRRRRN